MQAELGGDLVEGFTPLAASRATLNLNSALWCRRDLGIGFSTCYCTRFFHLSMWSSFWGQVYSARSPGLRRQYRCRREHIKIPPVILASFFASNPYPALASIHVYEYGIGVNVDFDRFAVDTDHVATILLDHRLEPSNAVMRGASAHDQRLVSVLV